MVFDIISMYLEADNSFIEYIQFGERPRNSYNGCISIARSNS